MALVTSGDLLQLPPVNQSSVCDPPPEKSDKSSAATEKDAEDNSKQKKKKVNKRIENYNKTLGEVLGFYHKNLGERGWTE